MAVIPEITCRRCGSKYSGLRNRCPKCGAPRMNQPTRVPPTTAAATPQTAANARSVMNVRWQYLFGAILLLAVILAVVVLLLSGRGGKTSTTPKNNSTGVNPSYISADLPTPSPSPAPTPEASPTPAVEQIAITFLNRSINNHQMMLTNAGEIFNVDLDVNIYPPQDNPAVEWRSTNEKILTVNERGFVTVVGATPNRTVHAGIIASYGGLEDYVTVFVPGFQAAYLTENLYDPDTYDADNLEWDTFIYATPAPAQ